jgi:hypothetical protein
MPTPPAPRPDRALIVLLFLLNVASAWTTIHGARQVLPTPLAEALGLGVQVVLFLLLAGVAGRYARTRRWVAVGVFAVASVYTSFFAYYETLAGEAADAASADRAAQSHAAFVAAVHAPVLAEAGQLEREADALQEMAEAEAGTGLTTGQKGYGPVAKQYAAEARDKRLAAASLRADLDRLAPAFETDPTALAPEAVYAADLAAWQQVPAAWKQDVPAPTRAAYVDLDHEIALLAPFHKVRSGEAAAVVALLLALLVDGLAVMLGTAIHGRREAVVVGAAGRAARIVGDTRDGFAAVREAWSRPALPPSLQRPPGPTPEEALEQLVLPLQGRGSEFLGAFYAAIHPETGALDYEALQAHPEPTWRVAARMLADRLRRPDIGWVVVRDGWWAVPPARYGALTAWLSDQVREAVTREAEAKAPPPALQLVLPQAA